MIDTLLNKSNEELREWLRTEIVEAKPDPEWGRRLKEYHDNIERDFQEEWPKKHFKWFFTKRRQKKLRDKITHRYAGPVFWLIEEMIDDMLPKMVDENFQKFVDIKDFALGDKAYFTEENHNG
jgi:hypothetical protein